MNRPRRFVRRFPTLTPFACAAAMLALAACAPAPTPTPAASAAPLPIPTATPTPTATPDAPATGFALDLLLTMLGYRQDGPAEVEVSVAVSNEGGGPVEDVPAVKVECELDGRPVNGCGGPLEGLGPDRFGPAEATLRVLAPMGAELRAVADDGTASNAVVVPERILGVERETWSCFSDRPLREASHENGFLGGCGGWTSRTVLKWDHDVPVRVWADPSGDALYVRTLEETLDRLASLLGLEFEWVGSEEDATLKAYVGVPRTEGYVAADAPLCQDAAGCAGPDSYDRGAITSASMSVWLTGPKGVPLTDEEVAYTTLHEALHALTGMHHRSVVLSVMSVNAELWLPSLSESDEALLRLHAHPLVRPGMTMPQVRNLIVFADELLDPPPGPTPEDEVVRIAERAYGALLEAGSARFRVEGGWPDAGCEQPFAGSHTTGRLAHGYPGLVRFEGDDADLILIASESADRQGWRRDDGTWEQRGLEWLYDAIGWRPVFTDPVEMLLNVITHARPGDVAIARPSERTVTLSGTLEGVPPPPWANRATLSVDIVLDAVTYRISGYEQRWRLDALSSDACSRFEVDATRGEYGVPVDLPAAVAAAF